MSYEIFTAESYVERTFTTIGPIFTPFYNEWGKNVYWQTKQFCFDPVNLDADSTSGSPVIVNGNLFIGFLNTAGGKFIYDGVNKLTVALEKGQTVMIKENCDPYEAWKEYNNVFRNMYNSEHNILLPEKHEERFWQRLEFCTWVEQTKAGKLAGKGNYDVINEEFVYRYLEKTEKMGMPKGKFTIDDGWAVNTLSDGSYTTANWEIDRKKFPHFENLIKELSNSGYDPGLWFNPFCATADSEIVQKHPEILTDKYFSIEKNTRYFAFNEEILRPYYREIFERYIGMGIRKLKIDIAYAKKSDMISMLRVMSEEIRKIDPTVEIESHIPDIFASPYIDTVRMNDVSIDEEGKWKAVTAGHYEVCKNSVGNKIINLDHIGSNAGLQSAEDYMAHWHLLREFLLESKSYPVVSNLPDIYSDEISAQFVSEINELYDKEGYRR